MGEGTADEGYSEGSRAGRLELPGPPGGQADASRHQPPGRQATDFTVRTFRKGHSGFRYLTYVTTNFSYQFIGR